MMMKLFSEYMHFVNSQYICSANNDRKVSVQCNTNIKPYSSPNRDLMFYPISMFLPIMVLDEFDTNIINFIHPNMLSVKHQEAQLPLRNRASATYFFVAKLISIA